tara:strand:- start:490 stop:831 length:342 start_codon:yes stop_codon:yes gene_type:complete
MRLIVFSETEINLPSSNAYEAEATWNSSDYLLGKWDTDKIDYVYDLEYWYGLVDANKNHPQKLDDLYVYDFDDEFLQLCEYHKWSKDAFVEQFLKAKILGKTKSKELGKYGKA